MEYSIERLAEIFDEPNYAEPEERVDIADGVRRLKQKQRAIITLVFQGYEPAEIESMLHLGSRNFSVRYRNALKALTKKLNKEGASWKE